MKSIKVKSYNKLIEAIKLDGDTDSWNGKLKKRIVDAIRLAKECHAAAKIARENGDVDSAEWLEKRAEDYELAAKNWNQDMFTDDQDDKADDSGSETKDDAEETETAAEAAERAQNAANRAKANAESAKQAAEQAKADAEDAEKSGAPEEAAEAKQKAEKAANAADAAEKAADAAQKAADEAKDAADKNDAQAASNAADMAEDAEQAAKDAANKAIGTSDDEQNGDGDNSNSDSSASDEQDGLDSDSDGSDSGGSDSSGDSSKSNNGGDADSGDDKGDKSDSKPDDGSDKDSGDDSDDDNSSSKGKGGDSSDSDEWSWPDGGSDDDEDDGDSDPDAPVKDPFADEEDIPSLSVGSPDGKEARDATVDDIIKQLSGLSGEARRGAVDGLKDLLGKKNESLTEAFKKSIREFDDNEWDDLNNETIDRIEKVKKIDTIDDTDKIKAKFKKWSDNAVSRQELEDEESDNIQKDVLNRRAQEKEADKYHNLESLKDFELDFENCIRDQVEMVMQDYQDYSEINPEYEDEDIIMKADVQKILPSEELPTVAVFFDQSTSWSSYHINKGNQAIATVKKKYVDTGLCKMDIYYFSDDVVPNLNMLYRGCTEAWPEIIRTIKEGDYKNVVIMSDSDIENQNNHGESYTVTGCVWWIWKAGDRADRCTKELRGMQHNYECEFH